MTENTILFVLFVLCTFAFVCAFKAIDMHKQIKNKCESLDLKLSDLQEDYKKELENSMDHFHDLQVAFEMLEANSEKDFNQITLLQNDVACLKTDLKNIKSDETKEPKKTTKKKSKKKEVEEAKDDGIQ